MKRGPRSKWGARPKGKVIESLLLKPRPQLGPLHRVTSDEVGGTDGVKVRGKELCKTRGGGRGSKRADERTRKKHSCVNLELSLEDCHIAIVSVVTQFRNCRSTCVYFCLLEV